MENAQNLSGLMAEGSDKAGEHALSVSDLRLTPAGQGFSANSQPQMLLADEGKVRQRSDSRASFAAVPKVAALLGCSVRTVTRSCAGGKYPGAFKATTNGGEGWMVPIAALPLSAQRQLAKEFSAELAARTGMELGQPAVSVLEGEYRTLWDSYEQRPTTVKQRAEKALTALDAYMQLRASGLGIPMAEQAIAESHGVSRVTLWRYIKATEKHPRQHWLPLLAPRYHGGRGRAEFSPDAYEWLLARYLNTSQTKVAVLIKELRDEAPKRGWVVPGDDTIMRRLKEEPAWKVVGGRLGMKALERSFPAVERSFSSLRLHELWESDGRRADVWCRWPDGSVARPFIIIWREVRTRLVLAVRGCLHPTADVVVQAFGNAMERAQAIPENAKLDNGHEYASKLVTGGQKSRYRYKVKVGEPVGIMTLVGTEAKWSKPAYGQDKPIESFWNIVANYCDQAAEFQGAYCGKDSKSKPEDFDPKRAIPLEAYQAKLANVLQFFNGRPHSGEGMDKRSPLDVYGELLDAAKVKRPNPAHVRLYKMGVAMIKMDKREFSLKLTIDGYGPIRYEHPALAELPQSARDRKLQVYYEPDDPTASVAVYDGGEFICDATPMDRLPFIEGSGELTSARAEKKAAWVKPKKAAIKQAKEAGQIALPNPGQSLGLAAPPLPMHAIPIDVKRGSAAPAKTPAPWQPDPNEPGVWRHSETGEVRRNDAVQLPSAELRRTPAELEALRQAQQEKNKPSWMKTPKTA
jgi:putative transposase